MSAAGVFTTQANVLSGPAYTTTMAAEPAYTIAAAPAAQYVSAAPQYVSATPQYVPQAVEYVSAAPAVQYLSTVAAPAVEVDQVNAFGQVVERDFLGGALAAAPQITYGAPIMQTYAAPAVEYVNAAPAVQYASTVSAPAFEVDQVNAFGQVVERDVVQAAPALVTSAPKYVSPPPMAGSSSILGTRKAAPLQLNTKAFQANLPSPYTMLPDFVAPETVAAPVSDPIAASMTASPSMSAMQGPFVFTAGAAYIGAPEKIIASAPKAEKAPPKAEKAPEKAPAKKGGVTKTKKGKRGCC